MSMRKSSINTVGYSRFEGAVDIPFPTAKLSNIACLVRNVRPIEGYKAICDTNNDLVFAIVSNEYKLVQHQEVMDIVQGICDQHPEWGTPVRSVYMSPNGARVKMVWRFEDIQYEIRPGDYVNPTIEALCSFDTSLAQVITIGGWRLVCSNGMMVGKILAEYKRKHTESLDLGIAAKQISGGMAAYSKAAQLWSSYAERLAIPSEFTLFEELPFHKTEKERIFSELSKQGSVLQWDIEEGHRVRKAQINAWDMYNILTYEATHNVNDLTRQTRILEGISKGFRH